MDTKNRFKENLKFLRKTRELKQSELAEHLKISEKTVSHWETGYTEPSISQLLQLAEFFEVPLEELIIGND